MRVYRQWAGVDYPGSPSWLRPKRALPRGSRIRRGGILIQQAYHYFSLSRIWTPFAGLVKQSPLESKYINLPNMDESEPVERAQQQDTVTIKQVSSGRFLVGNYRGDWNVVTSGTILPPEMIRNGSGRPKERASTPFTDCLPYSREQAIRAVYRCTRDRREGLRRRNKGTTNLRQNAALATHPARRERLRDHAGEQR